VVWIGGAGRIVDPSPLPLFMSPSDFLSKHVAAVAAGDLDAVTALYADDATLLSFDWTAGDRDAVRQRFADFFAFHGEIESVDVEYQTATDDAVFALYSVTGERGTFQIMNAFDLAGDACTRHFSNEVGAELDRGEVESDA
jgi:hypothetical protein